MNRRNFNSGRSGCQRKESGGSFRRWCGLEIPSLITIEGSAKGVEATKQMVPKYGKTAVFVTKTIGTPNHDAVDGCSMIMGLQRYISKK